MAQTADLIDSVLFSRIPAGQWLIILSLNQAVLSLYDQSPAPAAMSIHSQAKAIEELVIMNEMRSQSIG